MTLIYNKTINNPEEDYLKAIEGRLLVLLRKPCTWNHLLKNCLNTDPLILWSNLNYLVYSNVIIKNSLSDNESVYILKDYVHHLNIPDEYYHHDSQKLFEKSQFDIDWFNHFIENLPLASPVYSQWWYEKECYFKLMQVIQYFLPNSPSLLFIGSPTIGSIYSSFFNQECFIADIDQEILHYSEQNNKVSCQYLEYNVDNPLPKSLKNHFDMVCIDPPWSIRLLKIFILKAIQSIKVNGYFLISLPPILTRPNALKERFELLQLLNSVGLTQVSYLRGFTSYDVPEFEKRAYSESKISIADNWRTGDFFIFQKKYDKTYLIENELYGLPILNERWNQITDDKRRIFIKDQNKQENEYSDTINIINGMNSPILPTVSSRNPVWEMADIITTSNHALQCHNKTKLIKTLSKESFSNLWQAIDNPSSDKIIFDFSNL
jgi:hypothetical protein